MNHSRRWVLALAVASPMMALASEPSASVNKAVLAAEPSVSVQAEVVFASTKEGIVEPDLQKMQQTLGAKVKYLTLKKVAAQKLELSVKPQSVALPNTRTAEISLQGVKENVATVRVKLAPADATYTLGREKSLYLQAGPHDGGDLWLVLSQPK